MLAAGIWSVRCVEASRPAKCVMRENGKGGKGRNSKGSVDSLRLLVFHFPLLPLFPITLPLQATRKLNPGLQTSNLELLNLRVIGLAVKGELILSEVVRRNARGLDRNALLVGVSDRFQLMVASARTTMVI